MYFQSAVVKVYHYILRIHYEMKLMFRSASIYHSERISTSRGSLKNIMQSFLFLLLYVMLT